ncbi:2-oxoglutarate ferredoxin oxidoreductase subunit beta [Propionibacterium cyclohexanicum]|uniref:2-oxoglutarate ferredoxin oxidoreductase subunit beta n=1 Tax=Propionibacterium cyclohexanicum TaxID=64702 RepID=A0A1H9TBD1_9ACTN|nr:thiamine pyrophosphate-dependent enzyme [Propionibacterium cyclohexanicum]SER94089.1 2-oxoglutarate ferredoxin oxidoreductase subunit beta [Propionibacterium cyclohexanicum]
MSTLTSSDGLAGVPTAPEPLKRKDFISDQEVRWCPGCGDYSILAAFQQILPSLGIRRENTVVVSGIGCSSRLPYYMNTYGIHSIHGRALTLATGLAMTRPDLAVFVVTGDGDALSIGANHLVHALRRNMNITVLLFNNRIYGLTKGQYSPTSEVGQVTKSSPMGSVDQPLNPVSLALGAEATFVARALDSDKAGLEATLSAAAKHRGASLVEIYQNCSVFNDAAFEELKGPGSAESLIRLEEGKPIVFGTDNHLGVVSDPGGGVRVAEVSEVGSDAVLVHDPHTADPSRAFALSRLTDQGVIRRAPVGIFRDVERPSYDDQVRAQVNLAEQGQGRGDDAPLEKLLLGPDTWQVVYPRATRRPTV